MVSKIINIIISTLAYLNLGGKSRNAKVFVCKNRLHRIPKAKAEKWFNVQDVRDYFKINFSVKVISILK